MKSIAYAVTFLIVMAISAYFLLRDWHNNLFACTADVEFIVKTNKSTFKLDGDYDFLINKENKASINISGTFYIENEKHEINRIYFINYLKNRNDEYYVMRMVHKEVHSTDTTPTEVFEKLFFSQGFNLPFYLKVKHINKKLYLVEDLKRSYFTCVRQ
ncbi:hypothetical protein [Enterobacter roggenkampii]|uniref:hypothetical protein n=1 Tax=Enterobacter roggenkampii TaxID=1812935 RepID=UPI002A809EBF|nr:hypothetical protein [Enterobacter roggenkampii]